MTVTNLTGSSNNRKLRPVAVRTSVPASVREDTGDYDTESASPSFQEAVRKIEVDALRQTADAQICRLLKIANLLDNPAALQCTQEERALGTEDIRTTATLLEECVHALIKAAEHRQH